MNSHLHHRSKAGASSSGGDTAPARSDPYVDTKDVMRSSARTSEDGVILCALCSSASDDKNLDTSGLALAATSSSLFRSNGRSAATRGDPHAARSPQLRQHPRRRKLRRSNPTRAVSFAFGTIAVEHRFLVASCLLLVVFVGLNGLLMALVRHHTLRSSTRISRMPFVASDLELPPHGQRHLYRPADALPDKGDWTPRYARLREAIDQRLVPNPARSIRRVQELIRHTALTALPMTPTVADQPDPYDIMDCPLDPPRNYPYDWSLLQLLRAWDPDDTQPPPAIHQSVCIFDHNRHIDHILRYRAAELPFVVVGDPAVAQAVERWNVPGYLEALIGDEPHYCEKSDSNHFLYYHTPKRTQKKKKKEQTHPERQLQNDRSTPPVEQMRMSYSRWLSHANADPSSMKPEDPHWYFRLSAFGKGPVRSLPPPLRISGTESPMEYLYDELPFLQPRNASLYLVDPSEQKGIHCRFGLQGVIAESHFDMGRNAIVVLRGSRRYILNKPLECHKLALYPRGHPSGRHSQIDWSSRKWERHLAEFPEFASARGNELILQAGQVLFLPSLYFHYIVSLDTNVQCNTRSGDPPQTRQVMQDCGF